MKIIFSVISTPDPGLVRHNKDKISRIGKKKSDKLKNSLDKLEIICSVDISVIHIDDPVTV
ncbi:hypothetical protein [Sulfurovum sp. NBC37-1]|uniref:hypothetical protein n=1 Tax=Sulfurovum sp. (strain NBC37-1) TaxID=387093 RepID=UPI001E3A2270|nr:hypothetical protein [Sulfurovum sp. NBC37-1]